MGLGDAAFNTQVISLVSSQVTVVVRATRDTNQPWSVHRQQRRGLRPGQAGAERGGLRGLCRVHQVRITAPRCTQSLHPNLCLLSSNCPPSGSASTGSWWCWPWPPPRELPGLPSWKNRRGKPLTTRKFLNAEINNEIFIMLKSMPLLTPTTAPQYTVYIYIQT